MPVQEPVQESEVDLVLVVPTVVPDTQELRLPMDQEELTRRPTSIRKILNLRTLMSAIDSEVVHNREEDQVIMVVAIFHWKGIFSNVTNRVVNFF